MAATYTQKSEISKAFKRADIQINGDRPWDIRVHNEEFFSRILRDGSLGCGESYMEGWWDCDDLEECFFRIQKARIHEPLEASWPLLIMAAKERLFSRQDRSKCRMVIDQHYELGNDLYENMLDPTMTYTCGYWKNASNLEEAQNAKHDLIARKLGIKKGMKVLDIGCGWGGFVKHIAQKYGAEVVGVTLSAKQAEYAKQACRQLPVEILTQDYRDIKGAFDRAVVIGMFEHVGLKNHRTFMKTVHRSLKDGGLFMVHTIGSDITSSIEFDPWLDRYIFPNGHLPSIQQMDRATEKLFLIEDLHNFGPDYHKTLKAWFHNFQSNWSKIKDRYPDPFYRMWTYYLLFCAAGFRSRSIQLWQMVLSKDKLVGGYESVR